MTNTHHALKTHRRGPGNYVVLARPFKSPTLDGRFEIAQQATGEWQLFECADGYRGEWCNTFATKAEALAAARRVYAAEVSA